MKVSCPSCQTTYNIDDKRIPSGGAKLKCAKCQTTFTAGAAVPPPPAVSSGAVPLPGSSARPPGPGTAAVPLPGASGGAFSSVVPLPGSSRPPTRAPAGPLAVFHGTEPTVPRMTVPPALAYGGGGDAVPLPGFGEAGVKRPSGARISPSTVPLPGPPRAATSLPRAAPNSDPLAIPLPPPAVSAAPIPSFFEAEAVPLPGFGEAQAPDGFPEPPAGYEDFDSGTREDDGFGAIPLPGEEDFGAVALPGPPSPSFSDAESAPQEDGFGAIPLPARRSVLITPPPDEASWARTAETAREPQALPTFGDPSPPPLSEVGFPGADYWGEEEKTRIAPATLPTEAFRPGPPRTPTPAPPEEADAEVDFAEPDPDFAEADWMEEVPAVEEAAPAPAADFSFEDLPAPAFEDLPSPAFEDLPSPAFGSAPMSNEPGFELTDLPSPADSSYAPDLPVPAMFDLPSPAPQNLPSPADDPLFDFAPLPPPPQNTPHVVPDVSADFGNVDLDDLTSPIQASDGLEELSFVDDAGAGAQAFGGGAVERFHVRRRSGKIFGPFESGVIVKMLEDGQLLGNEDVSLDRESWSEIGTQPAFGAAIEKMVQSAEGGAAAPNAGGTRHAEAPLSPSMDKLKTLYEGRMAGVAVVDGYAVRKQLQKRLVPFFIAAVVVLVLGAGASLQMTKYGAFGLKRLFPSRVRAGSADDVALQAAKKSLLQDTYKSYREAKEATDHVLLGKEYPEVRAVWAQSVFYLQRRYAAASPAEVATATRSLEELEVLGEKSPEYVKASAGSDLVARRYDDAITRLQGAWSRDVGQEDEEIAFLLTEAYTSKGQPKAATELLTRLLARKKNSAKGLHALGNLYQAAGQADPAAKAYEGALAADTKHAGSAVELGAVEVILRKDIEKGLAAVDHALEEGPRARLGPAEVARARALRGAALLALGRISDATSELQQALVLDHDSAFTQVNLARALLAQRKFDDALPLFKDATGREPQNLEYSDGYLSTLIAVGKMNDALTAVTQANARFPGNARIAYLYGRVDDALDHSADAEAHYKRAIAGDPKLTDASLALARFYLRFRRVADAKAVLDDVATRAPDSAAVSAGLGELSLAEGQLDAAQGAFEKAVKLDGSVPEAHLGLSRVALAKGDLAAARTAAERALELDAHVKGGHLQHGLVLWKQGQLDEALAELDRARVDDPGDVKASVTLGAVRLDHSDVPGAEASLLTALAAEPGNPEANFYMAKVKARRAMYTQAIESMKSALERSPNRAEYHYELGLILRDAKQPNDAIESWKTAIKLNPAYADALEALGQAYLDQGKYEDAIASFQGALKAEPARSRMLGEIGDAFFQQARWPEAIARYQDALKADPTLKVVYYKIGRAFSEQNATDKAISWYQKATTIDPENAMPFYYLGFAYKERGKKKDAIGSFKQYLSKKLDAPDKKDIEEEIYDLEH